MTPNMLSLNTQATLLLTAPLLAGLGKPSPELLSLGEYKRLWSQLRELHCGPEDLLSPDATDLLGACRSVIEESRLQRLLSRGFLLSQVIEYWQARAIWVVSRADGEYPQRLKTRLGDNAPAVIYGCGDISLLETGGLAVVGSRQVDEMLIEYTMAVGRLTAAAGKTLVSGGARGIDQAAMRGALEAGGRVSGVLADSLERTALNREHRNLLMDGQLVLVSPYDPGAGFHVGNAMQRNKLIYALADASLVVNSDLNRGGTWAGAIEQLDKLRFVPVYVRTMGENSDGLNALRKKGAIAWPNPTDAEAFAAVLNAAAQDHSAGTPAKLPLSAHDDPKVSAPQPTVSEAAAAQSAGAVVAEPTPSADVVPEDQIEEQQKIEQQATAVAEVHDPEAQTDGDDSMTPISSPADALLAKVRELVTQLLSVPMKEAQVGAALGVSRAQAKAWLHCFVEEGTLVKLSKPVRYLATQATLLGNERPNVVAPKRG